MSKKRKFEIRKQDLLPGFETGRFEPARAIDRGEFASTFEDGERRDNRVSIRISGKDLSQLKKLALRDGVPVQNMLASIIHQYVTGDLREALPEERLAAGLTDALAQAEALPPGHAED